MRDRIVLQVQATSEILQFCEDKTSNFLEIIVLDKLNFCYSALIRGTHVY